MGFVHVEDVVVVVVVEEDVALTRGSSFDSDDRARDEFVEHEGSSVAVRGRRVESAMRRGNVVAIAGGGVYGEGGGLWGRRERERERERGGEAQVLN